MSNVAAVSLRSGHHFSKTPSLGIRLLTGLARLRGFALENVDFEIF